MTNCLAFGLQYSGISCGVGLSQCTANASVLKIVAQFSHRKPHSLNSLLTI